MLLTRIDDVFKLINANTDKSFRVEGTDTDTNKCIFFDTDKFENNLNALNPNTMITSGILLDVFKNSFIEGYIDYTRD